MIIWPYAKKTWSGEWWLGVFAWFCGPRLFIVIAILAVIEQAGELW